MTEKLTLYVKAGSDGVPKDWRKYRVVLKANGREVRDVLEADAFNGWYVQAVRDKAGLIERGAGGRMMTRRVSKEIRIERRVA